jgi:hypothetical protein
LGIGDVLRWLRDKLFVVRFLFPKPIRKHMAAVVICNLPSRRFMLDILVPAIAASGRTRMLFVGAAAYNQPFYRACAARGINVWSLDFDPAAAAYGAPQGHFVGDIRQAPTLVAGRTFDIVVFNGILGFGINNRADALAAVDAMAAVAEKGAPLVIGWNPGKTAEEDMAAVRARLAPGALAQAPVDIAFPKRGRVQKFTHRYEIFQFA